MNEEGAAAKDDQPVNLGNPLRPMAALEGVTMAEPANWVQSRPVDMAFKPKIAAGLTILLLDYQHNAKTHELYQRRVERLETMQAVQHLSQWQLAFDPATQRVFIHALRIWRNGNATEHAQMDGFRLLQREENLDRLMLDGSLTLVRLLPDVRVGDVLDVSFTIETAPRLFREKFSTFSIVPDAVPVGEFHLSVRFPAERAMQWCGAKGFELQTREWEGEKEWFWTLRDVPPKRRDEGAPSSLLPEHWVQVSDFLSWTEVADGMVAAWSARVQEGNITGMLEEIMAAVADPADRVERAIAFVQDEIRYLSVNIEMGGQIPAAPEVVLQRRFGDCKDKSFLLVHMLRSLGVTAHPILVHTAWHGTVERLLPTPSVFDHCIVECQMEGQRRWIDATIPFQGGGLFGRQVHDYVVGLPMDEEVTSLSQMPAESRRSGRYVLHETFYPDTAGGSSVLKVEIAAKGSCADDLRLALGQLGVNGFVREQENLYRHVYGNAKQIGELVGRDDRPRNEVTIAQKFEIPKLVVATQTPNVVALECRAHLLHTMLSLPNLSERESPLVFSLPEQVEYTIMVDMQNILQINAESKSLEGDAFHFRSKTRGAVVTFSLKRQKEEIPANRFAAHSELVKKVWSHAGAIFWLETGIPISRQALRQVTMLNFPREMKPSGMKSKWQPKKATNGAPIATSETATGESERRAFPAAAPVTPAEASPPMPPPATFIPRAKSEKIESGDYSRRSRKRDFWSKMQIAVVVAIGLGVLLLFGGVVCLAFLR